MSKIRVAVVGVCVSRDPFVMRYGTNYKQWYEVVNTTFQTSIISLMSDKLLLTEEQSKETCKKEANRIKLIEEINKDSLNMLIESNPDYIVLDLYSEIRYGIVKYKETYITNTHTKVKQTNFYKNKEYEEIIKYGKDKERYMKLFDYYFTTFVDTVKYKLPNTKILLVKGRYAHSYIDDDNIIRYMDFEKFDYIDNENQQWNELNEYTREKYNLNCIDMTTREYFSDPNYPYGFSPWHYEKKYYQDFIKEFNSICLSDILEGKLNTDKKEKKKRKFFSSIYRMYR